MEKKYEKQQKFKKILPTQKLIHAKKTNTLNKITFFVFYSMLLIQVFNTPLVKINTFEFFFNFLLF